MNKIFSPKENLSQLFDNCVVMDYTTIGESVNYAFKSYDDTLYIYFQGSNSWIDWIRNFLFFKKPYKDMDIPYYVHGGFLKAWKSVEDIIISKITETISNTNKYKWNKIIVIGYSHGAALSGLCYECCWFHRPDIRDSTLIGYGFESPRFYRGFKINNKLKERWSNYYVIRNHNDIVTHCPPKLLGFAHVGTLLEIGKNKKYNCVKSHYPMNVFQSLIDAEREFEP